MKKLRWGVFLFCIMVLSVNGSFADVFYGVDVGNDLWEIDPVAKTSTKINVTLYQTANGLAYDSTREQLFFVNAANTFDYWERSTNTVKSVGGLSLGLAANPNNLAYYNDAVWYFEHNSNVLRRATLTYTGSGTTAVPSVSSLASFPVLGMNASGVNTNSFGDIAIDANTATLYAYTSRGRFYSVDLNNPVLSFNEIVASPGNDRSVGLQLGFDSSGTLYGTSYPTGNWYTINTGTGAITQISALNTLPSSSKGMRDLANAASTAYVEP
jgi:hypothetical protein